MPIPSGPDNPAPRRLLRDVVFDKMLDAIQDGTLQPGERLNDDELVTWLGVSRTPIREAIAKLVDYGLVEMEANRYTRVVQPQLRALPPRPAADRAASTSSAPAGPSPS